MNEDNNNRLNEFRQLKKEIRGSDKHLIVGLDIAKEKHYAFFGTANGKTLYKRLIFDNSIKGFTSLLVQAKAIRIQNALKHVVFGLEPTADYHKPLGEFLIKQGHTVVLIASEAVKNNRKLLNSRWDKNDTKDCANAADLISQGKFLYYDYPSQKVCDLRSLLSFKRKQKKQEHSIRMRIRNHLVAQYFPELDKHYGQCESENLAIIKWCLNPFEIAAKEYRDFYLMVTSRDRGVAQHRRLRAIWEDSANSIGCRIGVAGKFEATMLVDLLKQIRESISATDAKIKEVCLQFHEYESLISIPGFGPAITAMTLGAIGNPFRFSKTKQVLKMAGLDLSASRSGKNSDNATPIISKKGKAGLRYGLYQAALIASIRNKNFIEYFTSKLDGRERERGIKTKMRVKLSAKMLVIAWTLMKKKTLFDPSYLKTINEVR
ncbi:MAG: IS110 family transposase [Desulfobulbaceae bacterium]|nr:IS110 family transposase [Desulfobulbaceae bacterium]